MIFLFLLLKVYAGEKLHAANCKVQVLSPLLYVARNHETIASPCFYINFSQCTPPRTSDGEFITTDSAAIAAGPVTFNQDCSAVMGLLRMEFREIRATVTKSYRITI